MKEKVAIVNAVYMSNSDWRWVDIEHAREVLGYIPQDRAEDNWSYD